MFSHALQIIELTLPEYILHVRQVLRLLLQSQLYIKIEKCELHVSQISFLGHIISIVSIQMDPVKVRAVTDWPHPASLKQVQWFLWFARLPQDIVSDRGPQFVARYWKAFCPLLGASVSLSLGFHPQLNG